MTIFENCQNDTVFTAPRAVTSLDELLMQGVWKPGTPLRLHLGCGENIFPGYVNIDYPSAQHNVMRVQPDFSADILALTFPPESVDEIRLEHVFEHFSRVTALANLVRWQQWLKVGGVIHIQTPDIVGCARNILNSPSFEVKMGNVRHLAGDQAASWAYHVDHWFEERFQKTLGHLGFAPVRTHCTTWDTSPHLANVTVVAQKSAVLSQQELLGRAEELLWQSTVAPSERSTYEVWCRQLRGLVDGAEPAPVPANTTPECLQEVIDTISQLQVVGLPTELQEVQDFNQRTRDRWVESKARSLSVGNKILDVGAGTCPYRALFGHCDYKTHDFMQYTGEKLGGTTEYGRIDFVSDITSIPVPDNSMDSILCTEVLEHVPDPIEAMREMARIVKPGGRIFVTAPLGSGLHQKPFHFYGGYTPYWYKLMADRFGLVIKEITANHGLLAHFSQMSSRVSNLIVHYPGLNQQVAGQLHHFFGNLLPRLLFSMDPVLRDEDFSVGFFVEYVKPNS